MNKQSSLSMIIDYIEKKPFICDMKNERNKVKYQIFQLKGVGYLAFQILN